MADTMELKTQKIMATVVTIKNNGTTNQYFVNGIFEKNYKKVFKYAVVSTAMRMNGNVESHIHKLSNDYNDCVNFLKKWYYSNPEIVEIQ